MKKVFIIFSSVSIGIILLVLALSLLFFNKNSSLSNREYSFLGDLKGILQLKNEQVQIIPDNYTIVGKPYGIYYKTSYNHIKELWIYNVNLISFPSEILEFPMLESLTINGTLINRIDEKINDFLSLKTLNLSNNKISKIENLDTLTNLNTLDLSYNNIREVNGLENLKNLTYLNLEGNKIEHLENLDLLIDEFSFYGTKLVIGQRKQNLNNMKKLNLKGNPFKCDISNLAEIQKMESRNINVISDCK